jgi:hypothetical protein
MTSFRFLHGALLGAILLVTTPAFADKVLVLPFQSVGNATSTDLDQARAATRAAVADLSHKSPTEAEIVTAQVAVKDGVADTSEEYRAAGRASSSDWTVGGHVEVHGATYRLELEACQVETGRVESLAREIDPAQSAKQIREMLAILVRPQGIANAEIPWERGGLPSAPPKALLPVPPPLPKPPPAPPAPPPPPAVRHSYAESQPWALGLDAGIMAAIRRPSNAIGSSTEGTLGGTFAYALAPVPGLEFRADLSGTIFGPKSLSAEAGARWAIPIVPSLRLFAGPEAELGTFVTFAGDKTARFLALGTAFVALGVGENVQFEVAGNIDFAAGSAPLVLGGGTARALVRF